jgi:hypothetical protein
MENLFIKHLHKAYFFSLSLSLISNESFKDPGDAEEELSFDLCGALQDEMI